MVLLVGSAVTPAKAATPTPPTTSAPGAWEATLTATTGSVRYVRVADATNRFLTGTELSVWQRALQPVELPAVPKVQSSGPPPLARVTVRTPRNHPGHGSALLALVLVVIIAVAIGVMIGRRIRPRPNVQRVV
jgi:hypothetical protein